MRIFSLNFAGNATFTRLHPTHTQICEVANFYALAQNTHTLIGFCTLIFFRQHILYNDKYDLIM